MLFAHIRKITPVHELMSLVLVVASVFHICLNAKSIGGYVKEKAVLTGILLALAIAITTLIIVANPHEGRGHGPGGPRFEHGPRAVDRD